MYFQGKWPKGYSLRGPADDLSGPRQWPFTSATDTWSRKYSCMFNCLSIKLTCIKMSRDRASLFHQDQPGCVGEVVVRGRRGGDGFSFDVAVKLGWLGRPCERCQSRHHQTPAGRPGHTTIVSFSFDRLHVLLLWQRPSSPEKDETHFQCSVYSLCLRVLGDGFRQDHRTLLHLQNRDFDQSWLHCFFFPPNRSLMRSWEVSLFAPADSSVVFCPASPLAQPASTSAIAPSSASVWRPAVRAVVTSTP